MIMPNKKTEEPKRIFTRILNAAHAHWGEITYDPEKKIASGVMTTADGEVRTAELSYDDIKNKLSLTVRLHLKRNRPSNHAHQVLKFQNSTQGLLSFLTVDEETPVAKIQALATVPRSDTNYTVASIFSDTYALLENEDLKHLLN